MARFVDEEHQSVLAKVIEARPVRIDARLSFSERGTRSAHLKAPRIHLKGRESRIMHLLVETHASVEKSSFVAIEIAQYHRGQVLVGSLGVVLRGR